MSVPVNSFHPFSRYLRKGFNVDLAATSLLHGTRSSLPIHVFESSSAMYSEIAMPLKEGTHGSLLTKDDD